MAIEAEALCDALRLALKFVDRAGGEGIMFLADDHNGCPESDAADVCVAVAEALGIEFAGSDYMALIGDGPLPTLIHRSALAEDTARAVEDMRDISTAPYNEEVRVRVGDMTFLAKLVPNASMDMEGVACDQWQATRDGEYPRCWSDACCWSGNEDDVASIQPTGWLPLTKEAADANR